jgi:hydroxymethylpyrimidine/phosphomethylpyrimidine kinase
MSVITALTAQNTQGVQAIHPVPGKFVAQQIDSVLQDISTDAIKIGMLHDIEIIDFVVNCLKQHRNKKIVIDPVIVAKDGSKLLRDDAVEKLRTDLFPLATLITPNLYEAEILLNYDICSYEAMQKAAKKLSQWGSYAVLLKGGHMAGLQSRDCLYINATKEIYWLGSNRIETVNTHGTGCTLSAAITALLAKEYSLFEAINQAKEYLSQAIDSGSQYRIGAGHGPVHHFYYWW